jgi:hypothetical protein
VEKREKTRRARGRAVKESEKPKLLTGDVWKRVFHGFPRRFLLYTVAAEKLWLQRVDVARDIRIVRMLGVPS